MSRRRKKTASRPATRRSVGNGGPWSEITIRGNGQPSDLDIDLGVLRDSIGYVLRRAQIAVFQDFARVMHKLNLRPAQYAVLAIIAANPGLKQTQVSEALGINRANFVPLLDELERRRLAKRERAVADRRSHALYLTAKGAAIFEQAYREIRTNHERRLVQRTGPKGKQQLLQLLEQLAEI